MPKRALCSIGVDVDAVAGWLGSYHGEDSPNDISRGMFAGEVGVPRLLKLFKKYNMKMAAVRDAGHEIGLHGYSHENPVEMTLQQQKDVLEHTFKQLTDFCGTPPKGNVAPWWETSKEGTQILLEKGIEYDHSSQAHDCQPFYCRDEDSWTKIDYKKEAKDWMKPLVRGNITKMVQIPANWQVPGRPSPAHVHQRVREQSRFRRCKVYT
ncbi:SPOSA6832_00569 [Sporobolomyces salmonicolor]|uniref:SPOSA6832_00569-mRNA-1:cds n=1 Tax=Sporidiobolus salmonicolor TaxID=5005 RepID=A0A0D6EH02_SPOSA|nr:SPOSA6832_00569 [Sporobolomyces salmonicolor]